MRRRRPANELRIAIDCLPLRSRQAMLDGIESNRIIVGAYTDRQGGVCPMLAAHRRGGRTSLASFARAWDRYTRAGKGPRPATERELLTLRTMLEASIAMDSGVDEELKDLVARHKANGAKVDTGERDRTEELQDRHGWAWMRLFRRYDAYEIAMEQLREAEDAKRDRDDAKERLPVG